VSCSRIRETPQRQRAMTGAVNSPVDPLAERAQFAVTDDNVAPSVGAGRRDTGKGLKRNKSVFPRAFLAPRLEC
jgi:hypothetical protein